MNNNKLREKYKTKACFLCKKLKKRKIIIKIVWKIKKTLICKINKIELCQQ